MSKILKIRARQVFDSRGNPTIEAEVFTKDISATAICPSGASTGTYEAYEKRDTNNKRYLGKSVLNPVNLINTIISKKIKNQNIHNQEKIVELELSEKTYWLSYSKARAYCKLNMRTEALLEFYSSLAKNPIFKIKCKTIFMVIILRIQNYLTR